MRELHTSRVRERERERAATEKPRVIEAEIEAERDSLWPHPQRSEQ